MLRRVKCEPSPTPAASGSRVDPSSSSPPSDGAPFAWAKYGPAQVPLIPTLLIPYPRPKRATDAMAFMDYCPVRGLTSFAMGGVLGFGMGIFLAGFNSIGPAHNLHARDPATMTIRESMRDSYHYMRTSSLSWMRNFAVVGGIFATVECTIEKARGKHDMANPILAGCLSGAGLAWRSGPLGMAVGCGGFAAFSAAVEILLPGLTG